MKVQNKKSSHQTNSYLKYALLYEQAFYLVVLQPIFFLISLRIGCRGLFCIIPSYNCSIVPAKMYGLLLSFGFHLVFQIRNLVQSISVNSCGTHCRVENGSINPHAVTCLTQHNIQHDYLQSNQASLFQV